MTQKSPNTKMQWVVIVALLAATLASAAGIYFKNHPL